MCQECINTPKIKDDSITINDMINTVYKRLSILKTKGETLQNEKAGVPNPYFEMVDEIIEDFRFKLNDALDNLSKNAKNVLS